jgi:hypothetical protein
VDGNCASTRVILRRSLWGLGLSIALGCGGSASETPFPLEPVPDYARPRAASATLPQPVVALSASSEAAPSVPESAKPSETPVNPGTPSVPAF